MYFCTLKSGGLTQVLFSPQLGKLYSKIAVKFCTEIDITFTVYKKLINHYFYKTRDKP